MDIAAVLDGWDGADYTGVCWPGSASPGLYCFTLGGSVVYVGQSLNTKARIAEHKKHYRLVWSTSAPFTITAVWYGREVMTCLADSNYVSTRWMNVQDEARLRDLELAYIHVLNPLANIQGKVCAI